MAIAQRPLRFQEQESLLAMGVRLLELRVDMDAFAVASSVIDFAKEAKSRGFVLLGTYRWEEACVKGTKHENYIEKWQAMLPFIDAVDIEYENPYRDAMLKKAKACDLLLVLSTHDFETTPPQETMAQVLSESELLKVDVVKLAYYARRREDLRRLCQFVQNASFPYMVWMAMGPWGRLSRIMAPFADSLWVYGYVDQANAAGQFSVAELHEQFSRCYPAYANQTGNKYKAS